MSSVVECLEDDSSLAARQIELSWRVFCDICCNDTVDLLTERLYGNYDKLVRADVVGSMLLHGRLSPTDWKASLAI